MPLGQGEILQPPPSRHSTSLVLAVMLLPGGQQEIVVVVGGHEVEVGLRVRPREDSLERPRLREFLLGVNQHSDVTRGQLGCNTMFECKTQLSKFIETGVGVAFDKFHK